MTENNIIFVDFKNKKRLTEAEIDPSILEIISTPSISDDKLKHFEFCMDSGMTRIVVDTTSLEVKVPDSLRSTRCDMNWSYKFGIADLSSDGLGVRGTLSFAKVPFFVDIPWSKVLEIFSLANPAETGKKWTIDE